MGNQFEEIEFGWVIVNIGHPTSGEKFTCGYTFRRTRGEAISAFCKGITESWTLIKRRYNYRVVRARRNTTALVFDK